MKTQWWKILGVILVIYAFIGGLLVPLKPGIKIANLVSEKTQTIDTGKEGSSNSAVRGGSTRTIEVLGYNTNFQEAKNNLKAWLTIDSLNYWLPAKSIQTKNNNVANLTFDFPQHLPFEDKKITASLLINSEKDASIILPNVVVVNQNGTNTVAGLQGWAKSDLSSLNQHSGLSFPFRPILNETIRNLFYHVPLWFGMILIFMASVFYSWKYLSTFDVTYDHKASAFTQVGLLYGLLGLVTGAIWAKHTWNAYWSWDVKQTMSLIAMLIYVAYFILRSSFDDPEKSARISGVFNIFAFAALIPLIFVVPRLYVSLHPGNGGNPGFGGEDLDNTMRLIFYPAIIGWTLFGVWMATLIYRATALKDRWYTRSDA